MRQLYLELSFYYICKNFSEMNLTYDFDKLIVVNCIILAKIKVTTYNEIYGMILEL